MKRSRLAVLAALPFPTGGGAPTEFRILRAGTNTTEKGDFLFDDEAAANVMRAYTAKGLDKIQIDYEHQSMQAPPGGGPAHKPAAGWFKPEIRKGELWATDVSWTTHALSMLAPPQGAPEYRYLSPVLHFNEETRRVTRLRNIALTNDPALDELSPLVAATALEDDMPCAECSAKDAKIKDIEEKCSSLSARLSAFEEKGKEKDAAMTSLTAIRSELCALTGQTTEAAAVGALKGLKAAHDELTALKAKVAGEKTAALTTEFKGLLDGFVAGGKMTPGGDADARNRGHWEKLAKDKGLDEAVVQLKAAAPLFGTIVSPGGKGSPTEKETGVAMLTAEDYAVAKMFGHDPAEVLVFKTEQLKAKAQAAIAGI